MRKLLIAALLFVLAGFAHATCGTSTNLSCVQAVTNVHTSGNTAITIPSVSAGDQIILLESAAASLSYTLTSSAGNTYTACPQQTWPYRYSITAMYFRCWIVSSTVAGSDTVTLSSSNFNNITYVAWEFSGNGLSGDKYGSSHQHNATALTVSTASSVASADEMMLTLWLATTTATTFTPGGSDTQAGVITNGVAGVTAAGQWRENTSASGAQTATATQSDPNADYTDGLILTWKVLASAPAAPTSSYTAGTYFSAISPVLSATSGNIIYTTDGSTPAANSSCVATNGIAITSGTAISSISTTTTVNAYSCLSGTLSNTMSTWVYTLAYPTYQIATDDFSGWYNSTLVQYELGGSVSSQFPLDDYYTQKTVSSTNVAAWTVAGKSAIAAANLGQYVVPTYDYQTGGFGVATSGVGISYPVSVRTAEQYSGGKNYSQLHVHLALGTQNPPVMVGTDCSSSQAAVTGEFLASGYTAGNNYLWVYDCNAVPPGSVPSGCTTIADTIYSLPEGALLSLEQYGSALYPTVNGVVPTGFNQYGYTGASHTSSGSPCFSVNGSGPASLSSSSYPGLGVAITAGYTMGNITDLAGDVFLATNNGTTNTTAEPNFVGVTLGGTVTDGTVIWKKSGDVTGTSINPYAYNWSGGNVGTNGTVTPIAYTPPSFTNYSLGTPTTVQYPWSPSVTWGMTAPQTISSALNYGGLGAGATALGTSSNTPTQSEYHVPISNNQWIEATIAMDTWSWNNHNWFLKLQSRAQLPPTAYNAASTGCYDATAIYIGTEPMYQSAACGGTAEYCGTNALHVTYNDDTVSYPIPGSGSTIACNAVSNYNIITGVGWQYSPGYGDQILAKFFNNNLTVYCKSGDRASGNTWAANSTPTVQTNSNGANPGGTTYTPGFVIEVNGTYQVATSLVWWASTPYPLGTIITDSNGNWQKVTTPGTSGASHGTWPTTIGGTLNDNGVVWTRVANGTPTTGAAMPTTWGSTAISAAQGAITVDNTVMWKYVGEACPSDTQFAEVGSLSLVGKGFSSGFPGLWAADTPTPISMPVFQNINLGSGDPCSGTYTCIAPTTYVPQSFIP